MVRPTVSGGASLLAGVEPGRAVESGRAVEGVAAREDGGVPAAALAYDREDAARAPAPGEGARVP